MTDPPIHVLHVYKDVHPHVLGGIERHVDMLRRSVPGTVSSVLVGSRSHSTTIRPFGGGREVSAWEFGRLLSAPLAPSFPFWVRRLRRDVVHVHMPNPTGEIAALISAGNTPIVASYHADVVRQATFMPLYTPVVRRCLGRASAIVCGTRGLAGSAPLLRGFDSKIEIIPYSVDAEAFSRDQVDVDRVRALRERLGSPLVVATGRLVYYKGFERLIRLAGRMHGSLAIVGGGPLAARLRAAAAGVANVTITGAVTDSELHAYLAAADCYVMASTSRAESFGIATAEAQAMGVPAVVTDLGSGTGEAIHDGVTGIAVAGVDDDALLAAVNCLLDDAELRGRMGDEAQRFARRRFAVPNVAAAHADVYKRALAKGRSDGFDPSHEYRQMKHA